MQLLVLSECALGVALTVPAGVSGVVFVLSSRARMRREQTLLNALTAQTWDASHAPDPYRAAVDVRPSARERRAFPLAAVGLALVLVGGAFVLQDWMLSTGVDPGPTGPLSIVCPLLGMAVAAAGLGQRRNRGLAWSALVLGSCAWLLSCWVYLEHLIR